MSRFIKSLLIALAVTVVITAALVWSLYHPQSSHTDTAAAITWGVDFSQSQAEYLQLNWKETYQALIRDLGVKNIKLHTNWNAIENTKDNFYFDDVDWQIQQAEKNNVKILYVLGMKTGRWPECHIPDWAVGLSKQEQQEKVLDYITMVVSRYKDSPAISYWQVENEPFLQFGECPSWYYFDDSFLKKEIDIVRSLDPSRKIIISDSGELSAWTEAANLGDIVGITMYRSAWAPGTDIFGISPYSFLNPSVYAGKAAVIKKIFDKNVICIELQAEPWASKPLMEAPLNEQLESMNPKIFQENVAFAQKTGLQTFYFWGAEWWYWLKTKQNKPEIWDAARNVIHSSL